MGRWKSSLCVLSSRKGGLTMRTSLLAILPIGRREPSEAGWAGERSLCPGGGEGPAKQPGRRKVVKGKITYTRRFERLARSSRLASCSW
jgi:hypothetical protein